MANKVYEIAFKLAGKLSSDFTNTFRKANEYTSGYQRSLSQLNSQAASMNNLIKLKRETGEASRAYIQAKQRVAELGRAMSATAAPTKKMVNEFNQAQRAADRAKISLDKKRTALRELQTTTGTTGTTLKTLINRQKELKTAIDKATAAQEKQKRITDKFQKATEYQAKLKENAMSSAGTLMGMAAAATGAVALPVKQAIAMEDAMAEVAKVTNFDPKGLKQVQEQLEQMSLKIPLSAEGLANIMASAAQSGVAQKDLISFTEQAAKMGVAFDITAEEAGTMMAKWQSGMGLTLDKTYELADAVNELSNANAATASQVGEVLKRYGALGKVAGLTEKQTAAFAASVIASGAEAEVAATGIKAFMRALGKGGAMSKKQAEAFGSVGLNPAQLQKQLQENAPEAIIKTLETIQKKIPKEQWNQYLSAMFGEEAAVAVGPMMQNLDGLKKNFELVGDKANYADSMLNEFKSRAATTSNALTLAKNAASFAARAIGTPLLEPLKNLSTEFVAGAENVGKWIKENQDLVQTMLKVAGVVVGGIAAFHALRIAVWFLASPFISLYKGIMLVRKGYLLLKAGTIAQTVVSWAQTAAMYAQTAAMAVWRGAMVLTQTVMKSMRFAMIYLNAAIAANPIGALIALFVALVAAGVYVWQNWDTIKAKAQELWASFSEKFPGIAQFVTDAFNKIKLAIGFLQETFGLIIDFIQNVFTGNWETAWQNVQDIFGNIFKGLVALAKAPINGIIELVNKAIGAINGLNIKVPDWVPGIGGKEYGFKIPKIPKLAEGGIATRSTLANIGEGREAEAVLPLSRLEKMLSVPAGGAGINVTFAPNITVTGGGQDAYADVKRGLEEGQANLKRELERLLNNQRRLAYY